MTLYHPTSFHFVSRKEHLLGHWSTIGVFELLLLWYETKLYENITYITN